MRQTVWLFLRKTPVARWLRRHPRLARLPRWLSFQLVPATVESLLTVRFGVAAGIKLELNPRWEVEIWEGECETDTLRLLDSLLAKGSVFYDIGGSIGLYSLVAARKGALAFAFEPDPVNVECIRRHARFNGLEALIRVIPAAVYSRSGELPMAVTGRERGHAMALVAEAAAGESNLSSFSCVTLDEFSASHPPPSLVKVDVEGAESEVLKGAEELFRRVRPRLLCETHSEANEVFLAGWLADRNYSLRWLDLPGRAQRHLFGEPRDVTWAMPPGRDK